MKRILISLLASILLISCTVTKNVNQITLKNIFLKNPTGWTLDEANNIINFYTIDNSGNKIFDSSPMKKDVYVRALVLNEFTISAMARKEVIEKRLDDTTFYSIANNYLQNYTNMFFDKSANKISIVDSNFTKGYTLKVFFENVSDPYKPIFLDDGYSYFFLENMNGDFSRVSEVAGLYVDDFIQLDGYLDVTLTFSPFASNGKKLFKANTLNESYKLIFNGLQAEPIVMQWQLN